jgi:glutathione peroxidase
MRFFLLLLLLLNTAFAGDFYSITEKTIKGEEFRLSGLKGKVIMVVNIASQCGFTGQLEELEAVYKKYKDKNFVVLGVPTNDFGGQTPEDDKAMLEFCQKNYNVTFPILTKKSIKGKEKRALYKFLTEETPKDLQGEVKWNFEKFLVDKNGKVLDRYSSFTGPDNKDVIKTIEAAIK